MKKLLFPILFLSILLIGFALRFYKLGSTPEGFYVDEAGQGYSAYSILKTGKDEFGKSFPFAFRSMTDFRTPVYTYLVVPVIAVLKLDVFSVRLPSAIFGLLAIPALYLLILELSGKKYLALMGALMLAISPWHLVYSRGAYETNVSLFFVIFGLYLLFKSLKKPYLIILSAILLAVSIAAYQSERVIIPLLLISIFIKYQKAFLDKKHKKYFFAAVAAALIASIPVMAIIFTPGFWARASGLNIFSYAKHIPDGAIGHYSGWLYVLVNGQWFLSIREFFGLYFSYLSPRFMFILGDYEARTSFPEISTFFIWQFPFYIWGLIRLITNKNINSFKFFVLATLFIFPIPAAVTGDPYSTIRALPLLIPQLSIISFGIYDVISIAQKKYLKTIGIGVVSLLIIYSLAKLYSSIFILNDYYRARSWQWGWREVAQTLTTLNPDLPITVDNPRGDVYLQLAFFLAYDPVKYQKENFEVPLTEYYTNVYHNSEKHIGKIITRPINWKRDLLVEQYLVADELGISYQQIAEHKLTLITEIKYPDGSIAFRIVKTNPK